MNSIFTELELVQDNSGKAVINLSVLVSLPVLPENTVYEDPCYEKTHQLCYRSMLKTLNQQKDIRKTT